MSFSRYYGELLRTVRRSGPTAAEARRDFQAVMQMQSLSLGSVL